MRQIPIPNIEYQPLNVTNMGPINQFMGVSTLDPFNLKPGTAVGIKNLTASGNNYPALVTRSAFAALAGATGAVTGIGLYQNTDLIAVIAGAWMKWTTSGWATLASGMNATAQWSFTNAKGNLPNISLIGVNGVDTPRKYDGTSVTNLTGLPSGVNFKMIDQHDERYYASDGKAIYQSAVAKPQEWASPTPADDASADYQIDTNNGETVSAIKAGPKHLMVFKRNMFAEMWGTKPSNIQFQRISETGAVGLNAVTMRDQTAYWIHDTGAFQYSGGLPRKDFSVPVYGYFAKMNRDAAQNACAVSTQESVLFSIPTGSSTVNDTTLEYLPDFGIWSVWQDFSPAVWAHWKNSLVYGDANGVSQIGQNPLTNTSTAWEWISPPFGGGPYSGTHQWYKLFYVIDLLPTSAMTVYVSTKAEGNGSSDWVQVQSILPNADYPGKTTMPAIAPPDLSRTLAGRRVIIPIQQVANSNWLRVKFTGTGYAKFHEINIQQREMPLR